MSAPAMNADMAARQTPLPRLAKQASGRSRRRADFHHGAIVAGMALVAAAFLPPAPGFAQTAPAAPTVTVHAGDQALTVTWTAPSGVTAYDLRYILTEDCSHGLSCQCLCAPARKNRALQSSASKPCQGKGCPKR